MSNSKIKRASQFGLVLFLSIGLLASVSVWLSGGGVQTAVAAPLANTCWATIDGVTVYSDTTSAPVQTAVDNANPNDLIKVAGTCAGVQTQGGQVQLVYIDESVTIQGGYTNTNWMMTPDPVAYPTVLDAEWNGRVVYIPGGTDVTLSNLIMAHGQPTSGSGGAVYHGGNNLTMMTSTITNSRVTGGNDGLVFG